MRLRPYFLAAAAVSAIAWLIILIWPVLRHLWRKLRARHNLIDLKDAAAQLYGELRGTDLGRFTEGHTGDEQEILDNMGMQILHNVDVYVRRAPSPNWELFPRSELSKMGVCRGATEIRYWGRGNQNFYSEPKVSRKNLNRVIKELKKNSNYVSEWSKPPPPLPPKNEKGNTQPGVEIGSPTLTVNPPAKYNKAQINRLLEAIDAFYPPILEIEQTMVLGTWTSGSLEANIRDRGAAEALSQMDQLRLKLIDPSERLDKELKRFGLYTEICRVLSDKAPQHDAFFAAFNELATVLRAIPENLSAQALTIFVEAKNAAFMKCTVSYMLWAGQKKKTLAELRESYLGQPTTD
jgi:hypothetical protein